MDNSLDVGVVGDRIESLLDDLRSTGDRRACAIAEELLGLVTDLYGAGLRRVMGTLGEAAPDLARRLADDPLVGSLLVVHDLHPEALGERVAAALATVRPFLAEHGGDVELLDVDEAAGAVHLRLLGSCDGCPSSAVTLQQAVERAILDAAPEIATIDVEPASRASSAVPVPLGRRPTVAYDPATGCGAAQEAGVASS